jgi:fucose permease
MPYKVLLHLIFFLSGLATVLIGQVLPLLTEKLELSDLGAAYFFPAQFAGSITGTFLTYYFGKHNRLALAAIAGSMFMASGILLINLPTFDGALLGFVMNGVGIGLTLPSINMLIMEMNPLNSATALNVLNFCWGAGAILSKPFVDVFSAGGLGRSTLMLSMPLMLGALLLALNFRVSSPPAYPTNIGGSTTPIWSTWPAWALAFFNFIHIGFESGMGGWLTTYSDRMGYGSRPALLSPTVLYFLFFVLGRAAAPVLLRYLSENRLILVDLLLILAGMTGVLAAEDFEVLAIGSAIAGFGTSSIFPTTVSRFGRVFGPEASRRSMPLFVSGTLGAVIVTWLIGYISDQAGELRTAMMILGAIAVALITLQIALMNTRIGNKP